MTNSTNIPTRVSITRSAVARYVLALERARAFCQLVPAELAQMGDILSGSADDGACPRKVASKILSLLDEAEAEIAAVHLGMEHYRSVADWQGIRDGVAKFVAAAEQRDLQRLRVGDEPIERAAKVSTGK